MAQVIRPTLLFQAIFLRVLFFFFFFFFSEKDHVIMVCNDIIISWFVGKKYFSRGKESNFHSDE